MTIRWTGDLKANLGKVDDAFVKGAFAAAKIMEPRSESYLKSAAPWTDRTGAARNGLKAEAQQRSDEIVVVLSHGVDYGIWLEIAHSGRYAVITPSLPILGAQFFKLAAKMVFTAQSLRRV